MKRNTLVLKCFLQFTCTNLDGCQKEGGNFLNLLHKEGDSLRKKRGAGGGLTGNCVQTYTNTNFKFFKKNEFCWNTFCHCLEFERLPPLQNDNFSKCAIWSTDWEIFYFVEKLSSVLKIFKFFYFYEFFQNS